MNLNFKIPNKFNMEFPSLPPIWTLQVSPKKVELEKKRPVSLLYILISLLFRDF